MSVTCEYERNVAERDTEPAKFKCDSKVPFVGGGVLVQLVGVHEGVDPIDGHLALDHVDDQHGQHVQGDPEKKGRVSFVITILFQVSCLSISDD